MRQLHTNTFLFFLILIIMFFGFSGGNIAARIGRQASFTEKTLSQRIADRDFPSVFQAWSPCDNINGEDRLVTIARHDLMWHGIGWYGLRWAGEQGGLADKIDPASINNALIKRKKLLELNPNMILLAEIRYRDAHRTFLPTDHQWWLRDKQGRIVKGWGEGGFFCLDFHNPNYRAHVAKRAKAVVQTCVVDGIMIDWWRDDDSRLDLIKRLRDAVGQDKLIIANANDVKTPRTAQYINGYFMECYRTKTTEDWIRIADTLSWAEKNLRTPRINCLETWFHSSRDDLNLMRATTAMSLTLSDGYCLFSDPNPLPTPDHLHNWYPFWDAKLLKPLAKGFKADDGAFLRRFKGGIVVYNPPDNKPVTVEFSKPHKSLTTGKVSASHTVPSLDGDIFILR